MPANNSDKIRQFYGFVISDPKKFIVDIINWDGERETGTAKIVSGSFIIDKHFHPIVTHVALHFDDQKLERRFHKRHILNLRDIGTNEIIPDLALAILGQKRIESAIEDTKIQREKWGDAAIPDLNDF